MNDPWTNYDISKISISDFMLPFMGAITVEDLMAQSYELVRESRIRETKEIFGKELTEKQIKQIKKNYLKWFGIEE